MNTSHEDVVRAKYNPMKIKFRTDFPKVPPDPANIPDPVNVLNQRDQNPASTVLQPKSLVIEHGEPLAEIQDIQDRPVQKGKLKPRSLTVQSDEAMTDEPLGDKSAAETQASLHTKIKHGELQPPKPALQVQHEEALDTIQDLPRVVAKSAPVPPPQAVKLGGRRRTLRPQNAPRRSPRF
jgi:hypothetical protein